jgi:hypothetical protein
MGKEKSEREPKDTTKQRPTNKRGCHEGASEHATGAPDRESKQWVYPVGGPNASISLRALY